MTYYFINSLFTITQSDDDQSPIAHYRKQAGNYFEGREQAEEMRRVIEKYKRGENI